MFAGLSVIVSVFGFMMDSSVCTSLVKTLNENMSVQLWRLWYESLCACVGCVCMYTYISVQSTDVYVQNYVCMSWHVPNHITQCGKLSLYDE